MPLERAVVAGESRSPGNASASVAMEMPTTPAGTQGSENFEGQSAVTGSSVAKPPDRAAAPTLEPPSPQHRTFLAHSLLGEVVCLAHSSSILKYYS